MIEELTSYISGIREQFHLKDFVEPVEGLHILLEVQGRNVILHHKEFYDFKKTDQYSNFLIKECLPRELHIDYIESHKALIGKEGKKIHSASPFALKFRKKSLDEEFVNWYPGKRIPDDHRNTVQILENELKGLTGDDKKAQQVAIIQKKIEIITPLFKDLVDRYFSKANEICTPEFNNDDEESLVSIFQHFCTHSLTSFLSDLAKDLIDLNKENNIIILLRNMSEDQYEKANSNYLRKYIFNVDHFNWPEEIAQETYGLSGYLNTAADKKPYLKHLTAPFEINFRIPQQKALLLDTFNRYKRAKVFKTNPLPIFIDKSELNDAVIDVIRKEGIDVSFHHIIRQLFEHKQRDLGNYYLMFFLGMELKDLDFVSSFSYSLDMRIRQIVPESKPENTIKINNIFDFEQGILQLIFNNQLIQLRKDKSITYRYFDDIDNNPKYITATIWNLVIKYRKAFYDFIYKSRRQAVNKSMFHDIMIQGILDDLRHDEFKDGNHSKRGDIHKKLNTWFSLWDWDQCFKEAKNNTNMTDRLTEHQQRLEKLIQGEQVPKDDDFYAFLAGQVIRCILSKSKADDQSYSRLEPFLQKTGIGEFKNAVKNLFNAYKHEGFAKRFELPFALVMHEEPNQNIKNLLPYILGGFFSDCLLFSEETLKKIRENRQKPKKPK